MQDYHEKKIKTAIDLLKISALLFFAAVIAFTIRTFVR
jgi:hypothetical protein